jgi:transposase
VITWGHSKDNQPKKKQTKSGAIVDGNGVLRYVSALDGNESDSTWNVIALKDLYKKLRDRIDQFIYIADSKMVCLPVFKEIHQWEKMIKFISLIPANFYKKYLKEPANEPMIVIHGNIVGNVVLIRKLKTGNIFRL